MYERRKIIMEHILQFGISIDDETIRKRVMETAEKKIMEDLTYDVKSQIFEKDPFNRSGLSSNRPSIFLAKRIDLILETCKDDIINMAAEKLADRLARTKKAKEVLDTLLDEQKGEK
jgi:hypothetical protein